MTKLTDLKGAREALPDIDNNYNSHIRVGYAMAKDVLDFIHLEVDVEAMESIIVDFLFKPKNGKSHYATDLTKELSTNIPKWARLVRR